MLVAGWMHSQLGVAASHEVILIFGNVIFLFDNVCPAV